MEKKKNSSKKFTSLKEQILYNIMDFFQLQELKYTLLRIGNKSLLKSFDNSINFRNINLYNKFYSKYLVKLRNDREFSELKERLISENLKVEKVQEILKDLFASKKFDEIFRIDKLEKIKEYDFDSDTNELLKNDLYDEDKRSINYFILKSIIIRNVLNKLTFLDSRNLFIRILNIDILDPTKIVYFNFLSAAYEQKHTFKEVNVIGSVNLDHINSKRFNIGLLCCNYNNLTNEISNILYESLSMISIDVMDFSNSKIDEKNLLCIFNIVRLNQSLLVLNLSNSLDKIVSQEPKINNDKDVFTLHEEENLRKNIKRTKLLYDIMESKLKILNLSNNSLTLYILKFFKSIIQANKLVYLDLSYCKLEFQQFNRLFKWISRNPYLKGLNLMGNKLSENSFFYLCNFVSFSVYLEFLNLSNTALGDQNFNTFNKSIKANSSLKSLFLNNNSFLKADNISIYPLFSPNLDTLSFKSCKLSTQLISSLINRLRLEESLKSLYISDCILTDSVLEEILNLTLIDKQFDTLDISNIKQLFLEGDIQESFLTKITYLQLKTLIFRENRLNKIFLNNFTNNIQSESLLCLDISSNKIDNSDFEHVLTILGKVKSLQKLYLNNNFISKSGIEKLISLYKEVKDGMNLNLISLNSNKLFTDGAIILLSNLYLLKGLQFIDLNNNQVNVKELFRILNNENKGVNQKIVISIFENSLDMNMKNLMNNLYHDVTFI